MSLPHEHPHLAVQKAHKATMPNLLVFAHRKNVLDGLKPLLSGDKGIGRQAKDTLEVAMGKKDCPASPPATKAIFLAEVGEETGDLCVAT
jgi:hypothetical protein